MLNREMFEITFEYYLLFMYEYEVAADDANILPINIP